MTLLASDSQRVIIFAPNGRDASVASRILAAAFFTDTVTVPDVPHLVEEMSAGAGMAIIADEAIRDANLRPLSELLETQPSWSDFPIVLMTRHGGGPEKNPAAARLAEVLGNVTFIERPFHPTTLASVVRSATRARRRQYEARARMKDLSESERRLENALQAGDLGSWTLDMSTMMVRISATTAAHFGLSEGDDVALDAILLACDEGDALRLRSAISDAATRGVNCAAECRVVWSDGSMHWVDMRAGPLKVFDGAPMQLAGVSSDISARKSFDLEQKRLLDELAAERSALSDLTVTLEQRVRERTERLMSEVTARQRAQEQLLQSQKLESIGKLTGGVAHDFNNLLMAVMGNLELIRKRIPRDARVDALIDGAMQGVNRGASLTQRMLAFARQQELKTGSADMASLIYGMRELLERSLGPHIQLFIHSADNLPPARVDVNQIELAILNLAINSRDAMPAGGEIHIGVDQYTPEPGQKLHDSTYLRVKVSDTGSGMDADTLQKAVEPFFSTKAPGKGTGLGLSMVHGLAEQLEGSLSLTSAVGQGTTATLLVPIASALEPRALEVIADDTFSQSARILVVDDDPLVAASTVALLQELGHHVVGASSGRRALEILVTETFDLLMTDLAMPGMNGIELAEIVHAKFPALPILLATGYAELPEIKKIDLHRLTKPYSLSQLEDTIAQLLGAGKSGETKVPCASC